MALVEGARYGLSASDNNNGSCSLSGTINSGIPKSVVFVKLTDSALKAIEDYLRSQHKTGQQPATLQFLGNEGRIHIPSTVGSNGRFDFSLSSNADIEGPQGSFECIQQCGPSSLKSMGTVPFKLRIQAKEDVYETTRQRMTALEETRKHDCAKEIKPNGADIGRRVKKKLSRNSIPPPMSHYQNNRQPSPNNQFKSQVNKPINGHNPAPYHHQFANNNNNTSNNQTISGTSVPPNNHSNNNSFNRNPISNPNGNAATKPTGAGDVTRKPLRDRLIHLLALKPFKKPELLARLHRDGIKDKDKKLLMPLLSQVSALKNNEYILNRGIWNDIQEDWPFYSEMERQMMKRRKPQNLTPPGSDCSVGSLSSLSPRSSVSNHSGQSPPANYSKQNGSTETYHIAGTKRPYPFDFDRLPMTRKAQPQPQNLTPPGSDCSVGSVGSLSSLSPRSSVSNNSGQSPPAGYSKPHESSDSFHLPDVQRSCPPDLDRSLLTEFPPIRTPEQRSRYKAEFSREYRDYMLLHAVIDKVSKRFAHLHDRLLNAEHGSPEYKAVKNDIVQEYNKNMASTVYQDSKTKFHYLHQKLSLIKRLVLEYDSSHSNSDSAHNNRISNE